MRRIEGVTRARDREEQEHHVAQIEGDHHGEDRAPRGLTPTHQPQTEWRGVQDRIVRQVAGVEDPGKHRVRLFADPAIGDLGSEDPRLESLDAQVVLESGVEGEYADLPVQRGQQQHRVPLGEEAAGGAPGAGPRRQQHEHDEQRVRDEQPFPPGDGIALE